MKTISLCMAMALLCLACTKTEIETPELSMDYCISAPPPACMPAPKMSEMVKFVPPVIKDDEVSEKPSYAKDLKSNKSKKIIKDGNISICVTHAETSKKYMDTIIKKFDAYYETEEFINDDDRCCYDLTIRIPSKRFEQFLKATECGGGEIRSKNINARDVSEDYYDTEIRLGSKRTFRDQYNNLLKKASKVPDILSIEENLRVLQEEIESQEGHLKYMDDQVSYSTLTVRLFTEVKLYTERTEETFFEKIKNSLGNGWDNIISAIVWTIKQWPWLIILTIFTFLLKRLIKRKKALKAN